MPGLGAGAWARGIPALVACLCAVAAALSLGGYLQAHAELDRAAERLDGVEAALRGRAAAEDAHAEALRRLAYGLENLERRLGPPPAPSPEGAGAGAEPVEPPPAAAPAASAKALPDDDLSLAWSGRVVALAPRRGGAVMIDRGSRDGLRQGDKLLVYRDGFHRGDLQVSQPPNAWMAVCRQTGGGGFRAGDQVRRDLAHQ
jgi:hypothetical protein